MYEAFYEANSAGYYIEEGIAAVGDNNLLVHFESVNHKTKAGIQTTAAR